MTKLFYGKTHRLATRAICVAMSLAALTLSAQAANLVLNGDFEQTLTSVSSEFGTRYPSQQVTNWDTNGFNFLFTPGTADSPGAASEFSSSEGNFRLWGPANGSNNGLTSTSPTGGNFLAIEADPTRVFYGGISQQINGLIPNVAATLTFYWAAGQQYTFDGPNTERFDVSLGTQTQSTSTVNNADHGFVNWTQQTFTFLPTSTSALLKFLAVGTPPGEPPFALLDGVTLTQDTPSQTPEPATWGLMTLSVAALGGYHRLRRKKA